jgi:hypothetical protein
MLQPRCCTRHATHHRHVSVSVCQCVSVSVSAPQTWACTNSFCKPEANHSLHTQGTHSQRDKWELTFTSFRQPNQARGLTSHTRVL